MDDLIHETDNAIEQILSDFETQAIGNTIYDGHQSAANNVATRATQLRNEILEALESVEVSPAEAEILIHWNRQRQHLASSRKRVFSKNASAQDHASRPPLPKVLKSEGFTDPEAKAISGEVHDDGEERRDSALALEWDPSQEYCSTDADLEEILERQDAVTKLLTKAQKSGKHSTFAPEAFEDGLQFTLRVYGKEDKLSYPGLWVPDPRLRYKDEEAVGEFDESRVVRVFFAKSIEKEVSPTRGRSRYQKRFLEQEKIDEEKTARPSFIAAGKYYACTQKLSPPTMVHPALRQPDSSKQDFEKEEPLQHVSWQPPPGKRYLPLKKFTASPKVQPTKQSAFRPGLPAILERAETALFPLKKKAQASPKAQDPKQGFSVPGRPAILHRAETAPVSTAHQMLRKMRQPAPKEPGSQQQNPTVELKPVIESIKTISNSNVKNVVLPKMEVFEESSVKNGRIMRQRFDVKSQVAEHFFPWHTLENVVEVSQPEEK
ncbi:hypothetical protein HII31_07602 [Pseudocercospora fuligena]|uniref:Uncharacterized protein n=1 Tax=Pseudocercospora fuligena TaxID=685502 RepID=A0A8H6RHV6_9PEZI|nr:hypothetical protein HII31_07602 [Pseudocercospora fuligena]